MSVTGSTTPETDRSGCGCEPMASHSLAWSHSWSELQPTGVVVGPSRGWSRN